LNNAGGDDTAAQALDDYFDAFNESYAASRRFEKLFTAFPYTIV